MPIALKQKQIINLKIEFIILTKKLKKEKNIFPLIKNIDYINAMFEAEALTISLEAPPSDVICQY